MTGSVDRAAIFRVTPEILQQLFFLPKGAYIDAVQDRVRELGVLELRVRGFGPEVQLGALLPEAKATVTDTRDAEGRLTHRSVEWSVGP